MERDRQHAERLGQQVLTPGHRAWPAARLEGLASQPRTLYLRGRLPAPGAPAVAIVGTRAATDYGLGIAHELAGELARLGIWIVSGFALGIDTAAHRSAVATERGQTLAVLGTGVDIPYPASNAALREQVPHAGGLVSEYPPGSRATRFSFPRRNRLIAAFSDVVVVVEAPLKSGAMITARLAGELGREVLAFPGHVRRVTQAGCHALIRRGMAALCQDVDDVLDVLGANPDVYRRPRDERREPALVGAEATIYDQLDVDEARGLDAISVASGLSPSAVTLALTTLELDGLARRIPGVGYLRS